MSGLFLDVYIVYLLRILWRLGNLFRTRAWTNLTATILGCHLDKSTNIIVRVDYLYATNGKTYAESFAKPFLVDSSAQLYAEQFSKGASFNIRVKPGDPSVSIADSSVENWSAWLV
jgi:hypothetical protein